MNGGTFNLLKNFETFYKNNECASICKVPLFYLTKSVELGPPKKECIEAYLDYIKM